MGTLRKKIQRQVSASVRKPPSSGPEALPIPAMPRIRAPASAARDAGSAANVIPRIAGHIIAAPMPIATRAAISHSMVGAAPPSAEKTAKITAPMKKILRRPSMSARRPPVTIAIPKTSA